MYNGGVEAMGMGDTRVVRTDVRTVFFLKGDWSLVELEDGHVAILRGGEAVNGYLWQASAMGKAVEAFRQLSKTPADSTRSSAGSPEHHRPA